MTDDTVSRATVFLKHCLGNGDGKEHLNHWVRSNAMAPAMYKRLGGNTWRLMRRSLQEDDGDNDATIVLLHLIADALTAGAELPRGVRRYAARTLRGVAIECEEAERGRKSPWHRNMAIVGALEILQEGGLPPTRNAEKKSSDPCGCDIVAEILCKAGHNISWRGVAEVWDTYAGILAPLTKIIRNAPVFRSNSD